MESLGLHRQPYVTHGAAESELPARRGQLAVADRLPTLGLPARVVWGEADQFQKLKYGWRLAHDLGTTLQPIRGGRHFTPEDHPEILAAAINELLSAGGDAGAQAQPSDNAGAGCVAWLVIDEGFASADLQAHDGPRRRGRRPRSPPPGQGR